MTDSTRPTWIRWAPDGDTAQALALGAAAVLLSFAAGATGHVGFFAFARSRR